MGRTVASVASDADFVERVLRTGLLALIPIALLGLAGGPAVAGGLLVGGALSLGLLQLQRVTVRRCFAGDLKRARLRLLLLWYLKLPFVAALIYALVARGPLPAWAFCAGVGLVPAVALARAVAGLPRVGPIAPISGE
jgi:hypothetical protein